MKSEIMFPEAGADSREPNYRPQSDMQIISSKIEKTIRRRRLRNEKVDSESVAMEVAAELARTTKSGFDKGSLPFLLMYTQLRTLVKAEMKGKQKLPNRV